MKSASQPNKGQSDKTNKKTNLLSPELELALFIILQVFIFLILFATYYKIQYTATGIYFDYAGKVLNGQLPYRDFSLEYPPFSLVFFILPRLFTVNYQIYAGIYQLEVLIGSLIGLYIFYRIARRLGMAPWKLLGPYTLCILAMGPIVAQQFDLFPAIMMLLALYFFWIGRHKTSWVMLGLGAMTKVFPVVIVPIFWVYYLRNHQFQRVWSGIVAFVVPCLILTIPLMVISFNSLWNLINYHAQRGIQIESIYGAFILLANQLGWTAEKLVFNFGSWHLSGQLPDTLARLSTYFGVLLLLIAYWFIFRQIKPGKSQFSRLGAYALLVVGITLTTSKLLSPQYLIWLIPLAPLVFSKWRVMTLGVFVAIGILTYYIFPVQYLALLSQNEGPVIALFTRDVLIIVLTGLAVVSLRSMKASD
jgi:hypothetical protein